MRLLIVLLASNAPAAPSAELTGTFLGWSGGSETASYLFEVEHATKHFMWIREKTKTLPGVRLLPGARLRFTVRPVGPKDQFADGMDGLLDSILRADPPSDFVQAVDRAMREVLQSMDDGHCSSAPFDGLSEAGSSSRIGMASAMCCVPSPSLWRGAIRGRSSPSCPAKAA